MADKDECDDDDCTRYKIACPGIFFVAASMCVGIGYTEYACTCIGQNIRGVCYYVDKNTTQLARTDFVCIWNPNWGSSNCWNSSFLFWFNIVYTSMYYHFV